MNIKYFYTNILDPKDALPERLYGVKIIKIREIENMPLGHLQLRNEYGNMVGGGDGPWISLYICISILWTLVSVRFN
jgi:hypothetical protein